MRGCRGLSSRFYGEPGAADSCDACPAGTFNEEHGRTAVSDCISCSANSFSPAGACLARIWPFDCPECAIFVRQQSNVKLLRRFRVRGFRVQGSGSRVQGSGFRVQSSGSRVKGPGLRVSSPGCRVQGSGVRVQDLGCREQAGCRGGHVRNVAAAAASGVRVQGSGCRVQGSGVRVQGPGFRVQGPGSRVQGPGFRVQG